jgi:hypothetical protein
MKDPKKGKTMRIDASIYALPALAALLFTGCLEGGNLNPEERQAAAPGNSGLNNSDSRKPNFNPDLKVHKVSTVAEPGSAKYAEKSVKPPEPSGLAKTSDINTRDVGVFVNTLATWNACPVGNRVTIKTDDEDVSEIISENNQSLVWTHIQYDGTNYYDNVQGKQVGYGWVPYSLQDGTSSDGRNNTILNFCKVPGNTLKPLKGDGRNDFLVLRLDTECPDGAYKISYYMDNEDDGNRNGNSGNIWPSSQSNSSGWTDFALCYFPANAAGVPGLPVLPIVGNDYAVFMNPAGGYGVLNGAIRFDEEDSGNNSTFRNDNFPSYSIWVEWITRIDKIIGASYANTRSTWYFGRKAIP